MKPPYLVNLTILLFEIFATPHIALLSQKNLIKVKEMWNDTMKKAMRGWRIASYCFLHALPISKSL
jgi:hypothetical protein